MEWWLILLIILGGLIVLMTLGLPIAFCFLLINLAGVFILMGGEPGLLQLGRNIFTSVTAFTLMPLPLFILMGEVMFQSGIAPKMMDTIDKWLGRLPGRLGLLAVGSGTMLSFLTGASMSSTAILGSVLVPEMEKRGYQKSMSLGPILGSGGLAVMIPPSALAVLYASIVEISIGRTLIGIIIPGILMGVFYAAYIVIRCWLQPSIAPPYVVPPTSLLSKVTDTVRYILPLGFIVFLVIGLIILGVATPTEAAATGTIGTFILAAAYRRLNWEVVRKSFSSAMTITVMIFMIIAGAKAYAQILAFSGATPGLVNFIVGLPLDPILTFLSMQAVVIFLGMFMSTSAVVMVLGPLFMPVVQAIGYDPIWFGVVFLICTEMGFTSPPYGANLFVMLGVAPPGTTLGDCYRAGLPFLGCDLMAVILVTTFPALALWLPGIMR